MAFPFVFGDSYGGVQGAQQADVNSDRSFTASLLAAQQAAQRMAMEQANQNAALSQNLYAQQANQAQHAYEFNTSAQQAEEDRALREKLGLAGLDLGEEKIAATERAAAKRIQAVHEEYAQQADSLGPSLASAFGELIKKNQDAKTQLDQAAQEYAKTDTELAAKESQGLIERDKRDKTVLRVKGDDPDKTKQATADRLNTELRSKMEAFNEAKRKEQEAQREFDQHMRIITSSGFVPGQGAIIFRRTGTPFPIPTAPQNSPKIWKVNPRTGTLE
jgi:hypothetical protein